MISGCGDPRELCYRLLSNRAILPHRVYCWSNQIIQLTVSSDRGSNRVYPSEDEQARHYAQTSEHDPEKCHRFRSSSCSADMVKARITQARESPRTRGDLGQCRY